MSNVEHLIENALWAEGHGLNIERELDSPINRKMLYESGFSKDDIIRMAYHIIYSLYKGLNPFDEHFDEIMEYYHFLKEQDHAPKYTWGNAVQNLDKNLPLPLDTDYDLTDDMSLGAMMLFGHDD